MLDEGDALPPKDFLVPYLVVWRETFGAYPTVPALLGKLLKPLDAQDPATTLRRWRSFVVGVAARPQFFGTPAKQVHRFASSPALYDDPDWYLTDRERADLDQLTAGL